MVPKRRLETPLLVLARLLVVAVLFGPVAGWAADDSAAKGGGQTQAGPVVRVMTMNMYQGVDFDVLLAPTSQDQIVAAATQAYEQIQATKPAERAAAMANEIAALEPDLVGLQEAVILRTGASPPATAVTFDLLQLLLAGLDGLGQQYDVAAVVPGFDFEAPTALGFDARLTTRDAIIVRHSSSLQLSNLQIQQFLAKLTVPLPGGVTVTDPRGWASIDVKTKGRSFRFVTTHLEAVPPISSPGATSLLQIQMAQARELAAAAGDTSLPVIFTGDFNAVAGDPSDPTHATYQGLLAAGLEDAWTDAQPTDPGFTCCQAPDLRNMASTLSQRIDLILFRGGFGAAAAELVGDNPSDRTPSGLWPSDHAGVAAALTLPGNGDAMQMSAAH